MKNCLNLYDMQQAGKTANKLSYTDQEVEIEIRALYYIIAYLIESQDSKALLTVLRQRLNAFESFLAERKRQKRG